MIPGGKWRQPKQTYPYAFMKIAAPCNPAMVLNGAPSNQAMVLNGARPERAHAPPRARYGPLAV